MSPDIQEKWASFILDLFQCNFSNPDLLKINPNRTNIVFEKKDRVLKQPVCDSNKNCRQIEIDEAEELCKEKKRVIKTIKPANIEILLKEAERRNIDLRVLLYFRQVFSAF